MFDALNNMKISRKMALCFGFISLLSAAFAISTITNLNALSNVATAHVERGMAGTEALGRVISHLREHRIIIWTETNASSPQEMRNLAERFRRNGEGLQQAIDDYALVAQELTPQLKQLEGHIADLQDVNERIFVAMEEDGPRSALPLVAGPGKEASERAIADAEALIDLTKARSERNDAAGRETARNAITLSLAIGGLGAASLLGVWLLISRTIAAPLASVADVTKTLAEGGESKVPHQERRDEIGKVASAVELFRQAAVDRAAADARSAREQKVVTDALGRGLGALKEGDLTTEVHEDFPAAYAGLKVDFNEAVAALRELIGAVTDSASAIRGGSHEITQASEDLARRTESNAASLEQTTASLAQVEGRVKDTASAAARTVQRADQALGTVGNGRSVAAGAVQAMSQVSESAQDIDAVIEGLDKIAFQTRVLAMNAAVEAGRAGEAGRGFAVVADLVSALAMRAEEEAKNAREQLTVTQTGISTAVEAVEKVDGALGDISEGVTEVHTLLTSIAKDNDVQSSALTQVSAAISDMDKSRQQNAAMVEETSAAARNLSAEVEELSRQAARFRTGGSPAERVSRPAATSGNKVHELAARASAAVQTAPRTKKVSNGPPIPVDDWNEF